MSQQFLLRVWDGFHRINYEQEVEFKTGDVVTPEILTAFSPDGTEIAFLPKNSPEVTVQAWNYRRGEIRSLGISASYIDDMRWRRSTVPPYESYLFLVREPEPEECQVFLYEISEQNGLLSKKIAQEALESLPSDLATLVLSYHTSRSFTASGSEIDLDPQGRYLYLREYSEVQIFRLSDFQHQQTVEADYCFWGPASTLFIQFGTKISTWGQSDFTLYRPYSYRGWIRGAFVIWGDDKEFFFDPVTGREITTRQITLHDFVRDYLGLFGNHLIEINNYLWIWIDFEGRIVRAQEGPRTDLYQVGPDGEMVYAFRPGIESDPEEDLIENLLPS